MLDYGELSYQIFNKTLWSKNKTESKSDKEFVICLGVSKNTTLQTTKVNIGPNIESKWI